jgi:hypothetical protein
MQPIERLWAAANFAPYDRPPFSDNEWNEMLAPLVPEFTQAPDRPDGAYSEDERIAAVQASMDMVPWSHVYDHPRFPILGDIPGSRDGQEFVDEDGFVWQIHGFTEWVERRPFNTAAGFLEYLERKAAQARQETPTIGGTTVQWGTAIKEQTDHAREISDPATADFSHRYAYAVERLAPVAIAIPYMTVGLDDLYRLAGWELLADAVLSEPQIIADYLDAISNRNAGLVHLYARHITAERCPVALVYSDIAGNSGLLLSPTFLRQALIPALAQLTAAYHAHGIKVVYHSEGDLRRILDDLIEAGIDGINTLSPVENMDPVEIRQRYPNLILWGGIDNARLLPRGAPQDVIREVQRIAAGVGKGLILGSSGGVHPACQIKNLTAMIEGLHALSEQP